MATFGQIIIDSFLYVGWWLIPLIVLFVYRSRLSKYPIGVVIYEKRGEQLIMTNDVAGRFNDPINCYRLKNTKDTIPIPEYDWVLQYAYKPTNVAEKFVNLLVGKIGAITLFKYASKQYKPIHVKLADGKMVKKFKQIRNAEGELVYTTVYEPIDVRKSMGRLKFEVIDWDDINHMTQELRAIAARRSPLLGFLEKYGGHIGIALGFMALIIGGYYYKELLIDAGGRVNTGTTPPPAEPAQAPTIPLIGDLG